MKSSLLYALEIIFNFSNSEFTEKDNDYYSSEFIIILIGEIDGKSNE